MLDDAWRVLKRNRKAVDAHGKFFEMPEGQADADDMHIGDVTHTHYHQPPTPPAQSSGLAKAALAAAALGAGAGLPIAGALMMSGDGAPAIVEPAEFTDVDRQYGLRLYKEQAGQDES